VKLNGFTCLSKHRIWKTSLLTSAFWSDNNRLEFVRNFLFRLFTIEAMTLISWFIFTGVYELSVIDKACLHGSFVQIIIIYHKCKFHKLSLLHGKHFLYRYSCNTFYGATTTIKLWCPDFNFLGAIKSVFYLLDSKIALLLLVRKDWIILRASLICLISTWLITHEGWALLY